MMKRIVLVVALAFPLLSSAATVPPYSPVVGQAASKLISTKLAQRGFPAGDPRILSTLTGVGTALTSLASKVAVGASWPTLLASIGIGLYTSGAGQLLYDKAVSWLWGTGDEAQISGSDLQGPTTQFVLPSTWPLVFADIGSGNTKYYYNSATGKWREFWAYQGAPVSTSWPVCIASPATLSAAKSGACPDSVNPYWARMQAVYFGATMSQVVYEYVVPASQTLSPAYVPAMKPTKDIVTDLPQEMTSSKLSDQALADLINTVWRASAAQAGYAGVPADISNPISASDVAAVRASSPSSIPTLNDYIAPVVNPATNKVTVPVDEAATSNASNPAGEGATKVDLGVDPGITAPVLEETPTASAILAPILGLFPDLRSYVVPSHSSQCPTSSFSLFGKALTINAHCTLLDSSAVRSVIAGVMAAVWVMVAVFIVLAA